MQCLPKIGSDYSDYLFAKSEKAVAAVARRRLSLKKATKKNTQHLRSGWKLKGRYEIGDIVIKWATESTIIRSYKIDTFSPKVKLYNIYS